MNNQGAFASFARNSLCVCLLLLCAAAASAQAGMGGINGLVSDPTGAVIPGASVVAQNHATAVKISTVSTAAGLYSFVSLTPGVYEITASQKGFGTVVQKNVVVTLDQVTTANISLKLGSVNEVVTVNETSSLMDPSNSTVGVLISAETIDRVPLLNRNVFDLSQLSPGVTPANGSPNSSNSEAIINISSGRPGVDVSSYTINGAIIGSVYYMLDGSPLGIAENNAAAIIPALEIPEDGVEEARVETQNTPASYQSGGAGVISLASKSGGNEFHGDAFIVLRPDVLAANDYFNKQFQESQPVPTNTPPSFHRYQEGAAIGGPILHEKLFFFADYEATQQQMFDGSNVFTVPTNAERTGDFSADPFTIYDPTQPDVASGALAGTRQSVAGNKITNPNPIALKFLSEMPAPNVATDPVANPQHLNNLYVPGLDPTTAQRFDIRIDFDKSEKQVIFGRFSFDRLFTSTVNAFNNPWDLDYAQNITNGRNILIGDNLTLNPTTVLQLRYSFTRHYEHQGGDPGQSSIDSLSSLGFASPTAADEIYKTLPYVAFNDYSINETDGVGGTANYNTFVYASENSDVNGTVTKEWGKHEISTGAEYMKRFLNVGQPPAPSGGYLFDYSATDQTTGAASSVGGSDFASFLFGMGTEPGTESNDFPNFTKDLFVAETSPYYALFVQDNYKATKTLNITAGLRWDIFGGKTERHNRLEYFDPKVASTSNGVAYTGAEIYASNGNRSPFTTNLKDFSPRLGVSWQPEARLVVRGGAGFYYGPSAEMVGGAGLNSDGYSTASTWNATNYNNDPNTVAFDGQGNGNTIFNSTAGCSNPSSGSGIASPTGCYSITNPFPSGVVPLITAPTGLANNLGTTLNTMLHSQRTQLTYNFNFGVEYEFSHAIVLSIGYVGSRGLFLPLGQVDLNQLDLGTIGTNQGNLFNNMVPNQWAGIDPATNGNFGLSTVPLWVALQQFPQFGDGSYGSGNGVLVHGYPGGDSEYSSLQTKVQKRLTRHFTTLASFTWAKLITDDGNPPLGFVGAHNGTPQDWRNMNFEHSVSPQDVKYQFTWDVSYDLPVGQGRAMNLSGVANVLLGNWTANGIVYFSTGVPIASPVVGGSNPYFNQRTDLACDPSKGAPRTAAVWFNSNCFVQPGSQFVAGTAPAYLDNVRTQGANDVDLSLFKSFKFGNDWELRFDVSSYNVANKPQFAAPYVPDLTDGFSGFGSITADLNSPRQFQFGSRFTF